MARGLGVRSRTDDISGGAATGKARKPRGAPPRPSTQPPRTRAGTASEPSPASGRRPRTRAHRPLRRTTGGRPATSQGSGGPRQNGRSRAQQTTVTRERTAPHARRLLPGHEAQSAYQKRLFLFAVEVLQSLERHRDPGSRETKVNGELPLLSQDDGSLSSDGTSGDRGGPCQHQLPKEAPDRGTMGRGWGRHAGRSPPGHPWEVEAGSLPTAPATTGVQFVGNGRDPPSV